MDLYCEMAERKKNNAEGEALCITTLVSCCENDYDDSGDDGDVNSSRLLEGIIVARHHLNRSKVFGYSTILYYSIELYIYNFKD